VARYRRSFWDFVANWSKVLAIIAGTAVLVSAIGKGPYTIWLSLAVAVVSAADVVLRFSERARKHDGLYREFSRLAQDIAENVDPTAADISKWCRRRLEIEMDEPGVIDWLERRCAAEEAAARGAEIRPEWRLNWLQVMLSQLAVWPAIPRGIRPSAPRG
jgi:hypothetical protein